MEVKHNLVLYLTSPTVTAIDAVQGDGARLMACRLMDGMGPWVVPDGVQAGLSYTLPDKKDGFYDTLEDGTPAAVISGNRVTIVLDPVLTQQPGAVSMSLILRSGERQIATFPIRLRVAHAPGLVTAGSLAPQKHGFDGKIYYGGPGGILIPLGIGDGVKVLKQDDGTVVLVSSGGGLAKETDPTVPAWAKQPQKPSYTAQEVGALPESTKIPDKVSDLTNDSGFISKSVNNLANYYTKSQTQEMIAAIPQFRVEVVQQLPAAGEDRVLYLVPFATAEGKYLEYIWVGGRFEVIGSQRVDLTGYATEEWVGSQLAGKLDSSKLSEAINDALAQAKKSGAFDGAPGKPGNDGVTPHIGSNGNWYIGTTDTGIMAQGPQGDTGRGIKSIARTSGSSAAGTVDTYTITFTDGATSTFQVRNGANGAQGPAYELTPDDKEEIAAAVIEGLPKYAGEVTYV